MPAYRMPLYVTRIALPALLAEGQLTAPQAPALVQYYVDATSFNMLLDQVRELWNSQDQEDCEIAILSAVAKAEQLMKGSADSRYDDVIEALRQAGLPEGSLRQIPLDIRRELSDGPNPEH
jgi:hypothetical protein